MKTKEIIHWIIGTTVCLMICAGLIYISIHYEQEALAYRALRNMEWNR